VTFLSEIWLEAYMATGSPYVFTGLQWGWAPYYNLPFVSQTISGFNPVLPVSYKYVSDFKIPEISYYILGNKGHSIQHSDIQNLSCYPNPATAYTIL